MSGFLYIWLNKVGYSARYTEILAKKSVMLCNDINFRENLESRKRFPTTFDCRSNPAPSNTCHQCCASSIASAEDATLQSSKAGVERQRSRCESDSSPLMESAMKSFRYNYPHPGFRGKI